MSDVAYIFCLYVLLQKTEIVPARNSVIPFVYSQCR